MHADIIAKALGRSLSARGLRSGDGAASLLFTALIFLFAGLHPAYGQASPDADLREARNLLVQHDPAGAEKILRSYVQGHPASADAHFLLGYTLFCEKKAVDSLAEYTAGARYRKPSADDLMAVGADYVLLKDNEDADHLFRQVTEMQPENELAWYYLGRARFYESRYPEALQAFAVCLRLRPRDVSAETNLGLVYQAMERHADAAAAYRQAIEWESQAGGQDGQPYLDLGILLRGEQRSAESLPYLKSAAEREPNNPDAHFELAKACEDLKQYREAEAQLRAVLRLTPDAAAGHYLLGRVLKAEGRTSEAEEEFALTSKLNGAHSAGGVIDFNLRQQQPGGAADGGESKPR